MTETGFREQGWEAAVLEATYQDHAAGLGPVPAAAGAEYVARLVAAP